MPLKLNAFKVISFLITLAMSIFICSIGYADTLQSGSKYKIIRPIYIMGTFNSRREKTLSKNTARAYLDSEKLATKSYTAFQNEVPRETVLTIISLIPNPWYLPFSEKRYLVSLDPDLSQGLDVELAVARGMEGSLDGLNSDIFSRYK